MAERRMFAKTIVTSDAFLNMPISARCLYFALGMEADDDGFVNKTQAVMRLTGTTLDDLNVLIGKKFIIAFEEGVIVIKHWKINNYLRNDRYTETKYTELKECLKLDENNAYVIEIKPREIHEESEEAPLGIPDVNQVVDNRYPQDRLGKDRLGKDNIVPKGTLVQTDPENIDIRPMNPPKKILSAEQTKRFEAFWKAYPKKQSKATAEKAWSKILPDDFEMNVILQAIEQAKQKDSRFRDMQYIPLPATWLNARSWENEYEDDTYPQPQAMARPQRSEGMGSFDADEFLNAAINRRRKG